MDGLMGALSVVAVLGVVVGGIGVVVTLRSRAWSLVLCSLVVVAGATPLLYVIGGVTP